MLLPAFGSSYLHANISINTTTLPNGTVNSPYSETIAVAGGCSPATWAVTSGALPAGIRMTAINKPISLTKAVSSPFTIKVTGCGGGVSTHSYTVKIQAAPNHVVNLIRQASTSNSIAGYNIYSSTDRSTWQKVNLSLIASTIYSDSTVSNGSTYYYAATAVDINGSESNRTLARVSHWFIALCSAFVHSALQCF
jgi:hypothetical protein